MQSKLVPGFALCATATFLLVGCGGSDDNGIPTPPNNPTLVSYVGSPDMIAAWADPSTLAFSGPTIGSYAGKRQFERGNLDPMTGVDLGQQAGVEMWEGSDGHVYAANLTVDDTSTPGPVQVSSETGATTNDVCVFNGGPDTQTNIDYTGVLLAADLVTPTASSYIYRLPGADGVCNTADDVVHFVHPNMSTSDAPMVAAAMPQTAIYSSDGSVTGYVAKMGANLVELDANLSNPVDIGSFGANIGVANPLPIGLESGYPTGRLFDVDGNIVFVDYVNQTTSAPLFSIPNWTPTDEHIIAAASPTTLYFAVNTPSNGVIAASSSIYAVPADGSDVPVLMSVQPGLVRQMEFPVGGSSLVAAVEDLSAYTIVGIPQDQTDGSAGVTLATAANFNGGRFTATSGAVYYTMWMASTTGTTTTRSGSTAGIVGMDGTVIQAPQAGSQFLLGGEVEPWAAGDTTTQREPFITVFEATGMTQSASATNPLTGQQFTADSLAGATLNSIDTTSNQTIAALGTFPSTTTATLMQGTLRGIGNVGFIEAYNQGSTQDPSTRDLYLVNTQTSGTLTQATANLGAR
jgi:hypothetical protein